MKPIAMSEVLFYTEMEIYYYYYYHQTSTISDIFVKKAMIFDFISQIRLYL